MNILVRGTSHSQNYADRIAAAIFVTSLTKYGKKTLILQTDSDHPIENLLIGKTRKATTVKNEFSFINTGMDVIWKNIRAGAMNAEDWSDSCRNISNSKKNGLDIADVSNNPLFSETLLSQFETFENIVKSADQWYDLVIILVNGANAALIDKMNNSVINGNPLINKEIVCVPQGPTKEEESSANKYFAVKNFDFDSKFTARAMSKNYGKNVFPIPYNIAFKDACLEQNAIHFFSTNVKNSKDDANFKFSECVSTLVGRILGIAEKEDKDNQFIIKKGK